MNPKDKLAAGRLMAGSKFKYFRSAILSMVPKEAPGLGTFGTTKDGVMFWDPAMAAIWSVDELAAVVIHEVSHLLRNHDARCTRIHAEKARWNQAADDEINDDLEDAGLHLPKKPFIPCTPKGHGFEEGLTAEEYYRLLEKEELKQPKKGQGQGQSKAGQVGAGAEGEGEGKPAVGAGWCGSAAGRPLPGEAEAKGQTKGRSDVELDRMRRTTAEAIRQEASKGRGTVPAGWARWADEQLKPPKIRWQDKLARITRGAVAYVAGQVDMHYTRPSRRQAGIGWGMGKPVLPAYRAPLPRVSVLADTSGSMGTSELMTAVGEVAGILKTTGAAIDFCACDASVHGLKTIRRWQELSTLMKGGGGTDMRPGFEALLARRTKPNVIIVITDGCLGGGVPEEQPPGVKVVWVVVGKYKTKPCDWGEQIFVDEEPGMQPED